MKRREFLVAISGLMGTLIGTLAGIRLSLAGEPIEEHDWKEHRYVFVVDVTKCIGCGRCVVARKIENDVPVEPLYFRTWVERYTWLRERDEPVVDSPEGGFHGFEDIYDENEVIKSYFVPKLCNQCEKPPCVQVCPVGATYKTEDGVVLVDEKYCIGCRYCIQACPYGARYLYPSDGPRESRRGTADKCTWCYHRITKGLLPACVEVCPAGARSFGDLMETDEMQEILRNNRIAVLKPEQGTKPKVLYIGIDSEVR
jgi:Fe-S-cluster-containing dehydrogenase component